MTREWPLNILTAPGADDSSLAHGVPVVSPYQRLSASTAADHPADEHPDRCESRFRGAPDTDRTEGLSANHLSAAHVLELRDRLSESIREKMRCMLQFLAEKIVWVDLVRVGEGAQSPDGNDSGIACTCRFTPAGSSPKTTL